MFNWIFDYITTGDLKEHNPNWTEIHNDPGGVIIGCCGFEIINQI